VPWTPLVTTKGHPSGDQGTHLEATKALAKRRRRAWLAFGGEFSVSANGLRRGVVPEGAPECPACVLGGVRGSSAALDWLLPPHVEATPRQRRVDAEGTPVDVPSARSRHAGQRGIVSVSGNPLRRGVPCVAQPPDCSSGLHTAFPYALYMRPIYSCKNRGGHTP
jgi:hypothetical protein